LKDIQNEKLINTLYNTFFKVKHPQSNIIYLRKNINTKVIVGIFVPFYIKQAQEYHVIDLYKDILPKEVKTTEELVSYLKKLAKLYHDNIPLDKQLFVMFIAECIAEFLPNNSGKS
jgi:hypothetical protein